MNSKIQSWLRTIGYVPAVILLLCTFLNSPSYARKEAPMSGSGVARNKTPPTPLIAASAIRQDFAKLYTDLQEAHYNLFAHRSKAAYDRLYRQQLASISGPMRQLEVMKLFQKFMAFGKFGHSRMDAPFIEFFVNRGAGGTALPLSVRVEDRHVFMTQTADARGKLRPGDEILAINGHPISQWLDRLGAYVSAERPYMTWALMETNQIFSALLWLELGPVETVTVTARNANGEINRICIAALTPEQSKALEKQYPPPGPQIDFSTREVRLLSEGIAYLRPGPFYNVEATQGPVPSYEDSAYRKFLDDAFGKILESGTHDLLIDLRNNPGGDESFSDPMIAWFATKPFRFASQFLLKASAPTKAYYAEIKAKGKPLYGELARLMEAEAKHRNGERYPFAIPWIDPRPGRRFEGRVYLLVNRRSYSNATAVAATVQDYRFGKIIGEETADLPTGNGAALYFDLPNTKLTATYPKSYFVRPDGDETQHGVVPDFPIAASHFFDDGDAALKEAIKIVIAQRLR